jgi:squalene cyclase
MTDQQKPNESQVREALEWTTHRMTDHGGMKRKDAERIARESYEKTERQR